jgi:uncharacterized protein YqgC (DUF456 family)
MKLSMLRPVLAVVAVLIWAIGYRTDNETMRWVAIAIIAAAMLLRFARPRAPNAESEAGEP